MEFLNQGIFQNLRGHPGNYKFSKNSQIKRHIDSTHLGIKYPCFYCDYKATLKVVSKDMWNQLMFLNQGIFQNLRGHPGNYKFSQNSQIKRHINSTHLGIKYPCYYCDYKATLKVVSKDMWNQLMFVFNNHVIIINEKLKK